MNFWNTVFNKNFKSKFLWKITKWNCCQTTVIFDNFIHFLLFYQLLISIRIFLWHNLCIIDFEQKNLFVFQISNILFAKIKMRHFQSIILRFWFSIISSFFRKIWRTKWHLFLAIIFSNEIWYFYFDFGEKFSLKKDGKEFLIFLQ